MRFLITFAYDGSKYFGYQKQPKKKTIQSEIEKALKTINNDVKVNISASGRTDAGVHAFNQKAHFDLTTNISCDKLKSALNSLTPDDIYIKNVQEVSDTFHARYNVRAKEYIYKINMGEYNPISKDYVFQLNKKLNLEEIKKALKYLEGEHNFKSFTSGDDKRDNYVRTIINCCLQTSTIDNDIVIISFKGTGFMRYMVRNMVGLLIEIGLGKYNSFDIINILEAEDRKKAGMCAPACGLYLNNVFYR